MTTTPSTASQAPAVSASQDSELMNFLEDYAQGSYDALQEAIAHIDAKLAQAREEGYCEGSTVGFKGGEYFYKERATAAEAKLEAIRETVKSLVGYGDEHASFISRANVLSLFERRSQADESGLPG